jgi:hypothetical protein
MSAFEGKADITRTCHTGSGHHSASSSFGKTLHAAGHRCFDGGEIAPERAWLGRDHLDPNNEDGRDHDEDNGRRLAHA